jgi:adenosylcobinamide-GDP ribazoletransferase
MKIFILMLQFFTRIPLPVELKVKPDDFPRGVKYFPVVGLVIGGFNALLYRLLSLGLDQNLTIISVVLFNLLITGALHVDGLADTCDGFFSARSKAKMLVIMRDSRIGTNGAIAVFFDLVLRLALLGRLTDACLIKGLLIAPLIARTTILPLLMTCPPARAESGLGNLFIGKTRWQDNAVAFLVCLGVTIAVLGYRGLVIIGLNLLTIGFFRQLALAKIGGVTGDTLGAMNEVSEIVTLLTIAVI